MKQRKFQARSSEDSKSLNVEQTHDRTGRLVNDTVAVQDDPQVYHEAGTLNIDNETLRERIEADMDFKIPGLPHSLVKHKRHDRFIRDETFRNRMIENSRDEDVCRQMDALADEDHTHHLTPQE